ncbi:phosphonate ABC transporter ATP-binding protein [Ammoniphilus resinae]|uniref:Phosphonate transport system ATP-binding protein n=1 Tax=Ammoniphilus resinae TaxID=861532 RepID=A0ABS4GV33_9BACL|nr:phosphonate ABC transporter ATP-binding protein [Ammoniphilus resinae]MBP1934130.1 phosphonate transport system ATP-binding protein [Ammoniphilus resinae]
MIKIKELTKKFGDHLVLDKVEFSIQDREFLVILGSSGAGKSTLLRCLNGLVQPTSGQITLNGMLYNKKNIREIRRKVGFIFQQYQVIGNLSVLQNVLLGRLGTKSFWNIFFTKEERVRAEEAIEMVGLVDKIYTRVDQLSGGQKQRVGIARAVLQNPQVILADEPVASLDPVTSEEILSLLKRINEENGTTIVCNLHQLDYAKKYGERIVGLRYGRIQYDGAASDLGVSDVERIYGNHLSMQPNTGKTVKPSSTIQVLTT